MNKPVAWMLKTGHGTKILEVKPYCEVDYWIPLYTHPVKDREKDRLRFSDEAFNRWLDESISDSGHTVYDLVENVCEAWHGWENSQYYTNPVKELTTTNITEIHRPSDQSITIEFTSCRATSEFVAILRKAQEQ